MRRVALLVALLLAVPQAPAEATDAPAPVETLWNLADIHERAQFYAYTDVPADDANLVGAPAADETETDLSSSANGSRVAFVRNRAGLQEIELRDRNADHARVVRSVRFDPQYPSSSDLHLATPVLSPSGDRVAFWQQLGPWGVYGSSSQCFAMDVGTAPHLEDRPAGCRPLAWIDDEHLLLQTPGGWNQVRLCTWSCFDPVSPVTGLPKGLDALAVGAGGTRIAWVVDGELSVGDLAELPSGAWEVTGARVLAPRVPQAEPGYAEVNVEPAFSHDGDQVLWVQRIAPGGNGSIVSRPFDGSTAATVVSAATSSRDYTDVAPTWSDQVPPGAVVPGRFLLGARSYAAAVWTPPTDEDLAGVLVTLTPPGGAPLQRFQPKGTSFYGFTGLALGVTYDVDLQAVDRSGLTGPVAHRKFTVVEVMSKIPRAASDVSRTTSFPIRLGSPGIPGATYDGAWRQEQNPTWQHWVNGSPDAVQYVPGSMGQSLVLSARVHDAYGNASAWHGYCCTAVPEDQTTATFSGGTKDIVPPAWRGTVQTLRRTSDVARITPQTWLYVVGSRCGTCGVMRVYVDGTLLKTVDTWARVTYLRRLLVRVELPYTPGPHVVTLAPAATKGRPDVVLDGFWQSKRAY